MGQMMRGLLLLLLCAAGAARAADAPDGTAFSHNVLAVDAADTVRIRYCGVPLQVKLANLQFKGSDSEKQSLKYLKETLKAGASIKFELEPDLNNDSQAPVAQLFSGGTHINLEMVKRGLAISDGRSKKFSGPMQSAQLEAMTRKIGLWGTAEASVAAAPAKPAPAPAPKPAAESATFLPPPPKPAEVIVDLAPNDYSGLVVADLSSKEYHFPQSRYAKSIRPAARVEYRSPDEAERAGKSPSPFSFPERVKAKLEKQAAVAVGAASSAQVIDSAKKGYAEAIAFMQEARKASKSNSRLANENWKKAAKIINEQLNRVVPIADADPSNRELQKLTEDMSMSLYSCNKYQSL